MPTPIYLDHNASTPIAAPVAAAMRPFLEADFGNPSSAHAYGVRSRAAIEKARAEVAALLHCDPDEVVFTGGGSEADNLAIKGVAWAQVERGRHLVTSSVEHPAVLEVCRWLQRQGGSLSVVPVDRTARVDPSQVAAAIRPDTVLVSVMHANNEVGTLEPIAELGQMCRARGVLLHVDGAQAVGKIRVDVRALGVDLYTVAGHKLSAPKGVGALFVRRGLRLESLVHGAGHESGRRAGTENVLEIVGLGAACSLAMQELPSRSARMQRLRDRLHAGIQARVPDVVLNGHRTQRLPNTLSLSFLGVRVDTLLAELYDVVAASAGAACHDGDQVAMSHVLRAMGIDEARALGTVRLSLGRETTLDEVDKAAAAIGGAVRRLRGEGSRPDAQDVYGEPGEHPATPSAHTSPLPIRAVADEGAVLDAAGPSGAQTAVPTQPIRLTRYTHGLGCACKLRPQILEAVLQHLPVLGRAEALVGTETRDDAAVWRIDAERAIVATVDLFTPIVDDPRTFGAIAAANALSDVYAMAAEPLFALNIVGFPPGRLPLSCLHEILLGGSDKAHEAGIPVLGGHSVQDTEPRYGMVIVGIVHPDRILRNRGARPGDHLVLTKPLGTGIISTAAKRGQASPEALQAAIDSMSTLNRDAASALLPLAPTAGTDITGFGLLGHLRELLVASGVDAVVDANRVPLLPEVRALARQGAVSGGSQANAADAAPWVDWDPSIAPDLRAVLTDAQTSGGLLLTLPADATPPVGVVIGEIGGAGSGRIRIRP